MYVDMADRRVVQRRGVFLHMLRAAWWSEADKASSALGSMKLASLERARVVIDELASEPLTAAKQGADPSALIDTWAATHRLGYRVVQEISGTRLVSRRIAGADWIVHLAQHTLRMWAAVPTEFARRRWDYGSVSMVPFDEGDDLNVELRGWQVDQESISDARKRMGAEAKAAIDAYLLRIKESLPAAEKRLVRPRLDAKRRKRPDMLIEANVAALSVRRLVLREKWVALAAGTGVTPKRVSQAVGAFLEAVGIETADR